MGFWKSFLSQDSNQVHSPNAAMFLTILLALPTIALGWAALLYHIFIMRKGLDAPGVQLFNYLLIAVTGGMGIGGGVMAFSRQSFSQTTMMGGGMNFQMPPDDAPPGPPPHKAAPAPPG